MAKVYIFLADGFEEIEALAVVDLLRRARIEIDMVSVTGKLQVMGSHKIAVMADILFEDAKFDDADMLVLPGGMPGTNHLMEHTGLDKLLRKFHSENKYIAAICAAPTVLASKGILDGKNAACYPGCESEMTGSNVICQDVVEDGNIITSRGLGTAVDFALAIIKILTDENTAKDIADRVVYRHYK